MTFTNPYRQHNYLGEHASDAAVLSLVQACKWDSNGDGTGTPQVGQWYFNTASDTVRFYKSTGWSELTSLAGSIAIGVTKSITQTVGASGAEYGSIALGLVDGNVFFTEAVINTGTTPDMDLEFGDASFSGSPNILYQIGQDGDSVALWAPSTDGDWVDRTPWGFAGLTGGVLYWRVTNNGTGAVNLTVTVKATGYETALT